MDNCKVWILNFLSDEKNHSSLEIIEHILTNHYIKLLNEDNKNKIYTIKINIDRAINDLFNKQYIKKSKNNIDYWLITLKGKNFLKNNHLTTQIIQNNKMDNYYQKDDINIKLDELNQKIESNSYEIYEMINVIFEELNKKEEENSNRINELEDLINKNKRDYNQLSGDVEELKDNDYIEIADYLEIGNFDKYLTIQDLSNIMNHLKVDYKEKSHHDFKESMIKFYHDHDLNSDEYIIEGRNTTYFMGVFIADKSILNQIRIEIIKNWINNNIIFTDNQKDRILFDDLVYEIVKSFRLDNINKLYYDNIDSTLKNVLRSLYENNISNNSLMKNNELVICYGLKYRTKISTKENIPKPQKEYSLKTFTYNWLNENLIRTGDSNNRLAVNEIYENIYPDLYNKNISFKKTNVTRIIGRSINKIFKGPLTIKRDVINNQTFYVGLKLKSSINSNNLTNQNNYDQVPKKTQGELIEEWLEKKISITQFSEKKVYLDEITSTFIKDLRKDKIKIEDSSGLRSNISRLLKVFYKEKTNKNIDTNQDEQLKRYYKNIEIKNI